MIEYRPYQLDLINQIARSINQGYRKILVVLPTAGGKTVVMGGLLNYLKTKFRIHNTLVIVPFTDLKSQTSEKLEKAGVYAETETYQAALNRGGRRYDTLIFDEAHHIMAESYRQIPSLISSQIMIGFTGTPYRADKCPLLQRNGGIFEDLVVGASSAELTQLGWLAELDYYSYPVVEVTDKKPVILFGQELGFTEHTYHRPEDKEPEIVPEYVSNFNGMTGIVFCRDHRHSENMAARFNAVGITAEAVSCYNPRRVTKQSIENLRNNKVRILTTTNMISEGTDIPNAKIGIMAREVVTSLTLFLQQIGRLLRPHNGERAKLLDSVGNIYRFGQPQQAAKRVIV